MNRFNRSLIRFVGAALLVGPLTAFGVANKCDTSIALNSSPAPVIEGDTLTLTEDVTVAAIVSGVGNNQCNLSVGNHVNDGKLEIFQVKAGSVGVSCALLTKSPPTKACSAGDPAKVGKSVCTTDSFCDSVVPGGDGACSVVKTAGNSLAKQPDQPVVTTVSGTLNATVPTAGLGGSTLGFLASYNGAASAGIHDAPDVCFDVPVEDAAACDSGALITIKRATGPGAPLPGTTNNWQYEVTVEACEHLDDVTAQGGSNGWAPLKNRLASDQAGSALHPSGGTFAAVRNANKKNEVILWTIGSMDLGDKETLTLDLAGSIPPKTPDCQLRYLSGPWSSTFKIGGAALKSDYTGRVSIFVTLDGDSSDCIAP